MAVARLKGSCKTSTRDTNKVFRQSVFLFVSRLFERVFVRINSEENKDRKHRSSLDEQYIDMYVIFLRYYCKEIYKVCRNIICDKIYLSCKIHTHSTCPSFAM